MKPVYSGHLRDRANVSSIDKCPLYRGLTKSLLKSQQNLISRTGGIKDSFIDKNIVLIILDLNLISILVKKEDRELMLWR